MAALKPRAIDAFIKARVLRRRGLRLQRELLRRRAKVTFFHQLDHPQSHLLLLALARLLRENTPELEVELVVVGPAKPDVNPDPLRAAVYAREDALRLARTFGLPMHDAPKSIPSDRVARCQSVLLGEAPKGAVFLAEHIGRAVFDGDHNTIRAILKQGTPIAGQLLDKKLAQNESRLRSLGHYTGGTLYFDGEWFLGLDRFDHFVSRLVKSGLVVDAESLPNYTHHIAGTPVADAMFFSFRSPYSYIALVRLERLLTCDQRPILRPLLPMVVRGLSVPRVKTFALVDDAAREAAAFQIPFGRVHDPLGSGVEILMTCFFEAEKRGRGFEFALEALRGTWAHGENPVRLRDRAAIWHRAGLSDPPPDKPLTPQLRALLEDNREALVELGHWGVPVFQKGDEAFWGQDRIPWLVDT